MNGPADPIHRVDPEDPADPSPAPRRPGRGRLQPALLGLFLACWAVVLMQRLGLVSLAGLLPLSLYGLYGIAGTMGWVAGNVYAYHRRGLEKPMRRRLLVVYLFGPAGIIYLLRAMAPIADQRAAPMVALWAFGVYCAIFAAPAIIRRPLSDRVG